MSYVDGFLLVVPKAKLNAYKKMAKTACKVWMDHGALAYRECIGEDLDAKWGLPYPKLLKTKKTDLVVFAYIRYKNRKHRDAVNAKVMTDKRLADCMNTKNMPFDMKRMSYGGFTAIVES